MIKAVNKAVSTAPLRFWQADPTVAGARAKLSLVNKYMRKNEADIGGNKVLKRVWFKFNEIEQRGTSAKIISN